MLADRTHCAQEEAVNPDNYNEQRPPESPFDTDDHAEMTQNVEPIAEWPLDDYRQTKNPQTASSAAEVSMSGTEGALYYFLKDLGFALP